MRFDGEPADLVRANLWLRAADRVQIVAAEFDCRDFGDLFDAVRAVDWTAWIAYDAAFPVSASSVRSELSHVPHPAKAGEEGDRRRPVRSPRRRPRVPGAGGRPAGPDRGERAEGPGESVARLDRRGPAQAGLPGPLRAGAAEGDVGRRHRAAERLGPGPAAARPLLRDRLAADRGGADRPEHGPRAAPLVRRRGLAARPAGAVGGTAGRGEGGGSPPAGETVAGGRRRPRRRLRRPPPREPGRRGRRRALPTTPDS